MIALSLSVQTIHVCRSNFEIQTCRTCRITYTQRISI
ncbi:hypothetical protein GYH30_021779 [Glycine max]|nr:hypothetical protein GYH30_021779 [Glycine max]